MDFRVLRLRNQRLDSSLEAKWIAKLLKFLQKVFSIEYKMLRQIKYLDLMGFDS